VMVGMGARRFLAAGTNIPPTLPTTTLVVDGIYRRTRNPFYLGTTLVYLGLGVAAGSVWAIGLVVPLMWGINVGVVAREERYLERKFGDAYRAYKARGGRWIWWGVPGETQTTRSRLNMSGRWLEPARVTRT